MRRAMHPNLSLARPHDRYEYATSRAGSEGSFKAENEVFLLMFDRAREPSRGGAGTWQRQVASKAAPRRRRVRVQHESTRREQWPGRTCRPRLLDGAMDQLHKCGTTD